MAFCLPLNKSKKFLDALRSGLIDPAHLGEMTSAERRSFFTQIVGDEADAASVNVLFESKLLLKNQQAGMVTWAKTVAGLKPEVRRDLLAKVNRMTEVLEPQQLDDFLHDLAAHRLGVAVTADEAGNIATLAKAANDAKAALDGGGDRFAYGRARVALSNYVNGLKAEASKSSLRDALRNPLKALSDVGGVAKSIKASMDDSAVFRQGWRTMWTHPTIWARNARQSLLDLAHEFSGRAVMDEVNADIISRPNSLNNFYRKSKLAVGTIEEAYPSTLPERIPVLGRAYKASEVAFTAFVHRTRADVFDKYIDIATRAGVDVTEPKQLESIGRLVNSLTGRGDLGALEPAANTINNIFFSPRFIKSHIDTLTAHTLDPNVTPFVKKQAALNLLKVVGGTSVVLATANTLMPGSVEMDPRSSDFGQIKVGNTRFDMTGGMRSVVTLAARLLTMSSKSTATGIVTKLNARDQKGNPKFGAKTGTDIIEDFLAGKLSPIASGVRDLLRNQDRDRNEPTVLGEAVNLFAPLPFTNAVELTKLAPNNAVVLLGLLADAFGISTNSYASPDPKKVERAKRMAAREAARAARRQQSQQQQSQQQP